MSTHVVAFLITAAAYYFARTQAGNARFSFGTGKIGVLGGFTSAVVLAIVAFLMAANQCTGSLSHWKFTSTRRSESLASACW